MTQITEAQLIESLKQLKEINPRKEWAVLLKTKILAEKQVAPVQAKFAGFMSVVSSAFTSRKLAYSFAAILILIVGSFGISIFGNLSQKQIASLTGEQKTIVLKTQINTTVKNIAQKLKDNPVQDSATIKILAKTLADMPGDVAATPDVKDLMQTVVSTEIADLQKTTLTDSQMITLVQAQDLYGQGKYSEALEQIMAISK